MGYVVSTPGWGGDMLPPNNNTASLRTRYAVTIHVPGVTVARRPTGMGANYRRYG